MTQAATRFERLTETINATAADQLEQTVSEQPGGVDEALDAVFDEIARHFNPTKAKDGEGVFQHEIALSDGTVRNYYLRVESSTCQASRGVWEDADVTLMVGLVDMLHIATGRLSGQKAFLTRKVKIRGNPFFGMKLGEWFDPA